MTKQVVAVATLAALAVGSVLYAAWVADPASAPVDLKALGAFRLDEATGTDADIPDRYRRLDGRVVDLDGVTYAPSGAGDRVPDFQLVYEIRDGWHGPPRVLERVFCTARNGGTAYNPGTQAFVRVRGTLHVGVHRDAAGRMDSVYRLDVDRVTPLR